MPSDQGTRPPTFHYEYSDDWANWVLDHGLPTLPEVLAEDDEVPIAYWAGPSLGAVLFRRWSSNGEGEVATEAERDVDDDHYSYVRTDSGWEGLGGGGGAGGPEAEPMRPRQYPDQLAFLGGEWQESGPLGTVRGLTGSVGAAARTIELLDRHGVTRRDVEAPLWHIVVCFDVADEVTVRVLDADGAPLVEKRLAPGRW